MIWPFRKSLAGILAVLEKLVAQLEAHIERLTGEVSEHKFHAENHQQQAAEKQEEILRAVRVSDKVQELIA